MIRFAQLRASLVMGLVLVVGGSSAFAGPTGWSFKDNPNAGRPWLQGYSGGSTSTPHRVVRPYVRTTPLNTGRVTLGPYFKASDGQYYSRGSNGRYYRYTAAGWVLH